MTTRRQFVAELAIVLLFFALVSILSQTFQKPVSLENGRGWDGTIYYKVAEQYADGKLPEARAPYVYRIGLPMLVATFFGGNLLLGFKIVNIVGSLLVVVLFVFWLRLYLQDWRIRTLLVVLFVLMWHGPVRFVYYYPTYSDPWLLVFLFAGLIGIHRVRTRGSLAGICLLGVLVFAGVLFREFAVSIGIAFLFAAKPRALPDQSSTDSTGARFKSLVARIPARSFIPLFCGAVALMVTRMLVSSDYPYEFHRAAIYWAYEKPFLSYVHAWFITFGPVIIILLHHWREAARFLAEHQFMLVYLLFVALVAWIGGSDTERFLLWGIPVVYLLIGRALEDGTVFRKLGVSGLVLVLAAQLASARVLWTIPDWENNFDTPTPILTILSSQFQYLELYSYHGRASTQITALCEYLVLTAVLLSFLAYRSMRPGQAGR